MEFKITTFNLRLNVSSDLEHAWPHRVNSVVTYIKESSPLIIGTQEALDGMLQDLKESLPRYDFIGLTRVQQEEASAIFYDKERLEVRESCTFWLSKTPTIPNSKDFDSACVRVCTYGEFIFKENRNLRFRVFNTHLDHKSDLAKIEGMKIIVSKMNQKYAEEPLPTMLTGDFNSTTNDEVIQFLNETTLGNNLLVNAYEFLPKEQLGTTFHSFTGETKGLPIDHLYVSQDIVIKSTDIFKEKIMGHYLSDHYPVTSIVSL